MKKVETNSSSWNTEANKSTTCNFEIKISDSYHLISNVNSLSTNDKF